MSIAAIKNHFANWREWEWNPIVVKELRQAVRSLAVTIVLLAFLFILLIASIVFLVFQSFDVDADTQMGSAMFSTFVTILAISSMLFIPLYMGIRVAIERQENNPDLLYVSTLSPARIIWGKFLCGVYIAVLFFSACMPFMAFTNFLRGVDLPTVFYILFHLFLIVCLAGMAAIFFACLPISRPFKILLALLAIILAPSFAIVRMLIFAFMSIHTGVGGMMTAGNFWLNTLNVVAIELAVAGLFFVLAVALISPLSANRALPVRVYMTVAWLLTGLIGLWAAFRSGDGNVIYSWAEPTYLLMAAALLVVISNSDDLSRRVRRTIPRSPWKRLFAFLFYNGAAGGLVWVALIVIVTHFAAREISVSVGYTSPLPTSMPYAHHPRFVHYSGSAAPPENQPWFAPTAYYIFAYSLAGLLIHRKFCPKRSPKFAGIFAISLMAAWAILPTIILFFLNQLTWQSVDGLQLGDIFNVFSLRDPARLIEHCYFSLGWLVVMILLGAKWFFTQAKNFRPPPQNEPPVLN